MKNLIVAFALVLGISMSFVSCRSRDKCDAYNSGTPVHYKSHKKN